MIRCPGQDQRFWKPEDIFEVRCHGCGYTVEFFKDEPKLNCRKCGQMVANPKIDVGCAECCQYARQCTAGPAEQQANLVSREITGDTKDPHVGPNAD
jgi:hypothetical protein